jgi:hypothetical protein
MKIIKIFLFAGIAALTACTGNNNGKLSTGMVEDNGKAPKMVFDSASHAFGDIQQGDIVSWSFDFVNKGDGDLLISSAQTSCGCTVPDYPHDPIKPGDKGTIKVKFNSEGKEGVQEKSVTIFANTKPDRNILKISANVIKPAEKQ